MWVCDRWEITIVECMGGERPEKVCVDGHYESRTTTTISNYGTPVVKRQCTDISCVCRAAGHLNCTCSTSGQPSGQDQPAMGYFALGTHAVDFQLSQVANQGTSFDPKPLDSTADLNLSQAFEVANNVEAAINDWGYARSDLEVVLHGAGGQSVNATYSDWKSESDAHIAFLTSSTARADVNGDGIVDAWDVWESIVQLDAHDRGEAWLSKADLNGDKDLTGKDLCEVMDAVIAAQ